MSSDERAPDTATGAAGPTGFGKLARNAALTFAIAPWVLLWWGPALNSLDRGWFACSSVREVWMAGTEGALVMLGLGFLLGLLGLLLADAPRQPFAFATAATVGLVTVIAFASDPIRNAGGMSTDTYCSSDDDPHGERLHYVTGSDTPVN